MKLLQAVAVALVLAAGCTVYGGTTAWQRKLEFAKQLSMPPRPYEDLSQAVIAEILADPAIKGEEQATLYKEMGKYYVDLTERVKGRDALARVTDYLGKARGFFDKYVAHPAIKDQPAHVGDIFDTRLRGIWITIHLARVHVRIADDPDTAKPEQVKNKVTAVGLYNGVAKEFEGLVAQKKVEVEKLRARAPQEKVAHEKWEREYNLATQELVRVRIFLDDTRVELGRFLKKTGAPPAEWRPLVETACADYKDLLLQFSRVPGITMVNVNYAEGLVELGPEHDAEALERVTEVWAAHKAFTDNKWVPCRAVFVKATILRRQKKYKEALDALDEMLKARTNDEWDPEVISSEKVTTVLQNLDDANNPAQFDLRAVGGSLLLEAEIYADVAKQAEDAKKPSREVERDYAIAYQLAVGVWDAKVPLDPQVSEKVELWRKKGRQPISKAAIYARIAKLLKDAEKDNSKYIEVAKLYTEILSQSKSEPEQLRKAWDMIARCYFGGRAHYEAHLVFTALSRWFPDPPTQASAYAGAAVAAIKAECDADVKEKADEEKVKFDKKLLKEARLHEEDLSIEGPSFLAVNRAKEERAAGRYDKALELFASVQQDAPAYPFALYETGRTHREMYEKAIKADPKTTTAAPHLKTAFEFFQRCVEYGKKKLPDLKAGDEEKAKDRAQLLEAIANNLANYTDALLSGSAPQTAKVIELTAGLKEAYPGIEKAFNYPVVIFNRMRAAYTICADPRAAVEAGGKALPVIDECWLVLKGMPEFKFLTMACRMGAGAYTDLAKRLDEQGAKAADPAAKADLAKQAAAARDRGLEFFLELLTIAPRQPLATYRYVLSQLDKRVREPKSPDYRKIVEIGAKAIELFGEDEASYDLKLTVAMAHCHLEAWSKAIPLLEEVDGHYEAAFQKRMKDYEKKKRLAEERPDKAVEKPKMPQRLDLHLQAREWLARCYLESKTEAKYKDAIKIYGEQVRLYPREKAKYWEGMSFLMDAARLNKNYDETAGQLYNLAEASDQSPVKPPARGSKADFAQVAARLRKDIEAFGTAAQKGELLPLMDKILKSLGK